MSNVSCVMYRVGGSVNYSWKRSSLMSYDNARIALQDVRTQGYKAFMASASEPLPKTFEGDDAFRCDTCKTYEHTGTRCPKAFRLAETVVSVNVLLKRRSEIVDKFNNAVNGFVKAKMESEAATFNKYLYDNDINIDRISFICPNCAAYATDRFSGIAICDNGCGKIPYEMYVI